MLKLPNQQWAVENRDIRFIGGDALRAYGPSINSWRGILKCQGMNHKPWPAFYTSSLTKTGYSDWINFAKLGTGRHNKHNIFLTDEMYVFTLDMEPAEIYVVEEEDDFELIRQEYGTRQSDIHSMSTLLPKRMDTRYTIDWIQMAIDGIDGVWIKDPHCHWMMRLYDVEQTIWLHMPKFKVVGREVLHETVKDYSAYFEDCSAESGHDSQVR